MAVTSPIQHSVPLVEAGVAREPEPPSVSIVGDALEAALHARAPAQHAGTPLVRRLATQVSRQLGLDEVEQLAVEFCAQVRDVGMIALPDVS